MYSNCSFQFLPRRISRLIFINRQIETVILMRGWIKWPPPPSSYKGWVGKDDNLSLNASSYNDDRLMMAWRGVGPRWQNVNTSRGNYPNSNVAVILSFVYLLATSLRAPSPTGANWLYAPTPIVTSTITYCANVISVMVFIDKQVN